MLNITDSNFKAISILYRKSLIRVNIGCRKYNLTASQAIVILIVCDFEHLTQDEITKRLFLDKSVIAKTVTKLVDTGFLTRTPSTADKRTYDIQPTEKAWQVYSSVKQEVECCFEHMTRKMTNSERQEFSRLLRLAAETITADH